MFNAISRWILLAIALNWLAMGANAQFGEVPVEVDEAPEAVPEPAPEAEPAPEPEPPRESPEGDRGRPRLLDKLNRMLRQSAREIPGAKPQKPTIDPESLEGLRQRLHEVQQEIARQKNLPAPKEPGDEDLILVLEDPHLSQGRYYGNNQYDRAFVVRLLIANPTPNDALLKRSGVTLTSDQKTYKVPERLTNHHDSYQIGQKYHSIRSFRMPETVKIPAGKTASTWLVFEKLPMNPPVPDLKLTLQFGKDKREIDVNEFCEALLKRRIERLGPENCLALISIEGKLDPVNVKRLSEDLDNLAIKEKVARVVIRWGENAEPVESMLMEWLKQSAQQAGQIRPANQNQNVSYPIVPNGIRELHLAEQPKDGSRSTSTGGRVHSQSADAIIAALRTAYQALPGSEIVDDLRNPNPVIRAAALMGGGGRLPPEKLPLLLEFAQSGDRNLERAAIYAMRNFGEKEAIEMLIALVKKNEKPRSVEAAESLATSRFAAASEALLQLLKTAEPAVKTSIVEVLAKYPRPIWADAIAEYARHPETPIGLAALKALNTIGHPDIHSMFKRALEHRDQRVQTAAFELLADRKDQASEELALEYTLKHLRTEPPTGKMVNLITRTKDQRAVPLLMRQFQSKKGNRYQLITLLAAIGDQSVVDVLVAEYPNLDDNGKRAVLGALQQFHSPEFVRLASEALSSNDSSLLNAATEGLHRDGSLQAEKALIEALKKDMKQPYWRYICNALVHFASPEAREALREARKSNDNDKKNAAISALRSLQQRSPGNQYMYQARHYVKQKQWDNALRYYTLAIEADSHYGDAYSGRGVVYLNQKEYKKAKADFEKSVQVDPENSQGHTGIAIMKVLDGQIDEGIEYAESSRKKIEPFDHNKAMLLYNTACVYGRAVEKLKATPDAKMREDRLKKYQTKAVEYLNESVKNHFADFELMMNDPDLKSLNDLPGFQKLIPGNKPQQNAGDVALPAVEEAP